MAEHSDQSAPDPGRIRQELECVLSGREFRSSRRSREFLLYIVEKTLQGESRGLKERTIAVEVYGRSPEVDLDHDSIVRVGAREVRRRLKAHYLGEGAGSEVRISLPVGSYVPVFRLAPAQPEQEGPQEAGEAPAARARPVLGRALHLSAAGLAVIAVLWLLKAAHPSLPAEYRTFWQSPAEKGAPLLIFVAGPDSAVSQAGAAQEEAASTAGIRPGLLVGFGEMAAAAHVSQSLGVMRRAIRVAPLSQWDAGRPTSSPAVLLGGAVDSRRLERLRGLPFLISAEAGSRVLVESPGGRRWGPAPRAADGPRDDYLLICRLPPGDALDLLVWAAGLTPLGTELAGRILASPEAITPILRRLPAGWESHNLALILHAREPSGAPAVPELVVWKTW